MLNLTEKVCLMYPPKTNVLMVLFDHPFPPDIRVEKEASTLKKNYNVFLLALRREDEEYFEDCEGIYVLRMDWPLKNVRILSYLIARVMLFLKLMAITSEYNVRILHVHDLPYALPVIIFGKVFRRKVVFDMHEYYVGLFAHDLAIGKFGEEVSARTRLGKLWVLYTHLSELLACKLATAVIVVVEENAERLIRLRIPKAKIVVVSNTEDIERLKRFEKKTPRKMLENKFIVSYVGAFGHFRGIDTLIRALPLVARKAPHIHLLIVGSGSPTERENLENLSEQLGVREHVTFTGWVSFNKAMEYMQISDLSAIPYHNTPFTNATVPHKIFQAMCLKKPVLVSDVKPLKRIVEETGCGSIFQAGNHTQLANNILKFINNPKLIEEMGEKGREAIKNKYNWGIDGRKLLQLYSELR